MKANYNTNQVMLTKKIKSSESAVALELISQLRRPGSSNACKCDQQSIRPKQKNANRKKEVIHIRRMLLNTSRNKK